MSHRRRPRFEVGGLVWEASLPCYPWILEDTSIGGRDTSAAGVPASYVVRWDALVNLRLRLREAEWPELLAVLAAGQEADGSGAGVITWYPDALVDASIAVWLEAPAHGEEFAPSRLENLPRLMELDIVLRAEDQAEAFQKYFERDEYVTVNGVVVTVQGEPVTVAP